jgi:hypothetical protein
MYHSVVLQMQAKATSKSSLPAYSVLPQTLRHGAHICVYKYKYIYTLAGAERHAVQHFDGAAVETKMAG